MADEEDCEHGMEVLIHIEDGHLAISLDQPTPDDDAGEETSPAIANWHYWVDRGYQL